MIYFSFFVQIFQLEEKDTQTKLEILFKKNLYAMAIRYHVEILISLTFDPPHSFPKVANSMQGVH